MHISFSPMRREGELSLSLSGDVLTINDEAFDFTALPDGATLPREAVDCEWLDSDVVRVGGQIRLALILPHGTDAPQGTKFPQSIDAGDGPVDTPRRSNLVPELEDAT